MFGSTEDHNPSIIPLSLAPSLLATASEEQVDQLNRIPVQHPRAVSIAG